MDSEDFLSSIGFSMNHSLVDRLPARFLNQNSRAGGIEIHRFFTEHPEFIEAEARERISGE